MNLKGFSLLLVDDDADMRHLLMFQLQSLGCNVLAAENGRDALSLLSKEHCDLVLLDIVMPDTSGLEVLETIRQSRSMLELPVIMITSLSETTDIVRAMELGANDYVTKPIDLHVAFARIRTHLKMRRLTEQNEELMRIATHDLKKPLVVIQDVATVANSELMQGQCDIDGMTQMFDIIERSTQTMQTIIEDFLELNAIESGQIKFNIDSLDINQMIRECVERNASYAKKKRVVLELKLAQGLPRVRADVKRLEQVLENLLGNAIKFSPKDTTTTLYTRREDDWVMVEISDQGPGFKPETLNKAFAKFSQLGNQPTGGESSTGLGLAICRQLIEAQSGEIGLYNNNGIGATFWFHLLADV